MVAPIRYLSRRIQEQKIGILQNTEEEKVLEVVGRVGIGTTIFDAEYNLDVRGTANVSGILSVGQIISGAGNTFSDLTVTGDTDLQSDVIIGGGLTVTGVSTFQSAARFADGTEAEPSISFINDTDLGLYRPADNEIAFTNGGSESVRITSDGKVGIGTTQPLSKLSVFSSDVVTETRIESTDSAGYASIVLKSDDIEGAFYASSAEDVIILRNNSNTTGTALGLAGTRSGGADIAIFRETRNVLIGNNPLVSSQTGTANQKLQVQSGAYISGSVGIGTTLPSQKLDVNGNVNIRGELHGPEVFIIDPAAVGDNTGAVRIKGDLYVDGTEFIVDSENILLADYRVGIATTVTTNSLLDGAGISIGATNIEKTFTYNNTANTLESSIGLGVTEGGEFKTGTDSVLNRTTLGPTVVNSSLTNLGTLTELNVSGVSTFAGAIDANGDLDVDGHTELDDLNVSGVSTFTGAIDANGDLDVDGSTELDDLNVSGVSTFAGAADFNGDLDVDGHTELDDLNVSGFSTFSNTVDINATAEINTLNVSLLSNFSGDVDVNASLDIQDNLTVTGLSSFFSNVDITGNLDVDGHTELDDLKVSGVSTFIGKVGIGTTAFDVDPDAKLQVNGAIFMAGDVTSQGGDGSTGIEIGAGAPGIGTEHHRIRSAGGSGQNLMFESQTADVFAPGGDIIFKTGGTANRIRILKDGNVGINTASPIATLDVNGTLNVSGVSTFAGAADFNGDLDVDGHTELDDLNVSGVSTFSNTVDINATAEIDTLNVSLLSNFSGDVDVNASLDIQDNLTVTGLSSFFSNVDITGDLDVNGHTELDDLNVSGVSTFTGATDFNGDIDVDGHTELDDLNVSGVSTFTGTADFNGDIDVDGHTELDDLNVSGVSTFAGDISIADKITHIGDTDTAIRFPAADTFSVETNGTERLRVKSNGRIAIGADGIASYLIDARTDENPSSGVIGHFRNNQGNGTGAFLAVGSNLKGTYSMGMPDNTDAFTIVDGLGNDGTERLRITSAGDVGIGTDDPLHKIHADGQIFAGSNYTGTQYGGVRIAPNNGGGQAGGVIYGGQSAEVNSAIFLRRGFDGNLNTVDINSFGEIRFFTDGALASQTEKLRITSAGNVGIGTDNIVDQLTLGSSTNQLLGFETDNEPTIQSYNANLHINTAGNDVVFDGNGSVGIGTDNPTTLLDIRSAANVSNFLTLGADRNGADTEVGILFKDRNVVAGIQTAARINSLREGGLSNFSLIFSTSASSADATEKLRITSSGDVGIGTDAPSQLLDVNGDVRFRDKIFDSTGDSGVANYVLASGGPGAPWSWKLLADVGAGNLDAIFVRQDGSDVGAGGTNTTLDFYENFSLTQPVAGIASIRLSDDINISGILTVGQLNINDTAGISTVISYDAVDQQRELQNIVIDCGTY